ncbi:cellobiose transport system substrate-binding protein [Microbacteriaceae bacterium SG_E_30_P1]|uniref:Cellobiose transport system substrate-binding protein n=1 Tax=Antiquaquibacter oligotrophicus TaxID=2880260 RepID=A0ABT6KQD6_9MICO|nr:extracellular solute-binding protein [Antiquaquibacter oligotrophicus]MDH6182189.1 cellobiose transport system substrate-binding protein [Antiquaquibacter oligotrophicus]UDF12151.1 extracellular solute-binding protein [Antiquaquibacter oligotrophicus]
MFHHRRIAVAAAASALILLVVGCAPAAEDETTGDPLTITTFGDIGYSDALFAQFTKETGIEVVHTITTPDKARSGIFQNIGEGGLADVEAIDLTWIPDLLPYTSDLAPVSSDLIDRWLPWKVASATAADGTLFAYGATIDPQAICYRSDLFEQAGLPTDPAAVAALFPSWDAFFTVGAQYTATTGEPFVDSITPIVDGMINQLPVSYEERDGTVVATTNPAVREVYDSVVERAFPIAAFSKPDGWEWALEMDEGGYAAMLCGAEMRASIPQIAPDIDTWSVANTYPGGGMNTAGTFLVVPATGDRVEDAQALAAWLTLPENQLAAYRNAKVFPSTPSVFAEPVITNTKDLDLSDAPIGQISADRALAITELTVRGPGFLRYHDALVNIAARVFDGHESAPSGWDSWVAEASVLR